jgi:hypothetical protein
LRCSNLDKHLKEIYKDFTCWFFEANRIDWVDLFATRWIIDTGFIRPWVGSDDKDAPSPFGRKSGTRQMAFRLQRRSDEMETHVAVDESSYSAELEGAPKRIIGRVFFPVRKWGSAE